MMNKQAGVRGALLSMFLFMPAALPALALSTSLPLGTPLQPAAAPGTPLASSFNGPLWQVVAPRGGTATVTDGHLRIHVPAGANHDPLRPANQAVRVVQPMGNQDFDVSIKIDSPLVAGEAETSRGLMVLADDQDFLTFALGTDGAHITLTVHSVSSGVASTLFNDGSFSEYQNPIYLRLQRTGDNYTGFYSVDGVVWTQAAAFTSALATAYVGPFAGNYSETPARAVDVMMAIRWFDVL